MLSWPPVVAIKVSMQANLPYGKSHPDWLKSAHLIESLHTSQSKGAYLMESPCRLAKRCLPCRSLQVCQLLGVYGKQLAYFMESFQTRPLKGAYTLLYRQAPCRLSDRCLLYWKSLVYLWKVSMQADWKVLTLWSLYAGWLKGAYLMESLCRLTERCLPYGKSPCRLTERCLPYGVSMQADWKVLTLWSLYAGWLKGAYLMESLCRLTERCLPYGVSMQADWKVLTLWSLYAGWLKGAYLMESLCRLTERCLPYGVSMQADWKVLTLWSLYAGWLKGAYLMESLCRLTERCLPYGVSMQADWKVLTLWSLYAGWLKGAYLMESLHVGWLKGWNGNQAVVQHEFLVQQWSHHCNQYTSLQKNQGSKLVPV